MLESKTLSDMAEILMGQSPPGDTYNTDGRGMPFFQGKTDFGEMYPTLRMYCTEPKRIAEVDDILISVRAPVGPTNLNPIKSAIGRGLAAIRAGKGTDTKYLLYFFRFYESTLAQLGKGSTFEAINRDDLENIRVPLPPLPEQQRIATRLDRADRLRRTRRYAQQLSDSFLQAVFVEMFGDPITNSRKLPITELDDLARIERGRFSPRPRGDSSYYGGAYPFIQTGDISNSGGRLRNWTQTLNEKGTKVSKSFPAGTIAVAIVGATIGATAILETEVYCTDSIIGIQVDKNLTNAEYIEFLLRFWRPVFLAQAPETARANLNLETFRPLKIPMPPLPLQQKFARIVQQFERLRAQQREAERQAEHLFQSLLQRAFADQT